jgi:hypothetical protein
MTTRTPVMLSAALAAATGVALIVDPDFVVRVILGVGLSGSGLAVGRGAGVVLVALGLACWPSGADATAHTIWALFTYDLLLALYFGYLSVSGGFVSSMLWPACALHALLALLLAVAAYERYSGKGPFKQIANSVRKQTRAVSLISAALNEGDHEMSQNHFTLAFPLKSPTDAKALGEQLPPIMPGLFQAEDTIGTVHYSRFAVLSDKTLLLLGDFDGELSQLMTDLAKHAGPVFDAIFQHVDNPPPTPVADHADEFVKWTAAHLLHALNLYTAYPGVTAKEIKALAAAADVSGAGELNVFLVVLPIKSKVAFLEVELLLKARGKGTTKDLDKVGTPHFAQFVPLEDYQIGFFTVYDGSFDTYIADFTKNIGQVFDLLFKFTKGAPPSPCRKYLQEFIDFAEGANRAPIGFYQAYPGLSVQDIHALIADSKSQ